MVYVVAERAPYHIHTKQTLSIVRENYVPVFSIGDLNAIRLYSFATRGSPKRKFYMALAPAHKVLGKFETDKWYDPMSPPDIYWYLNHTFLVRKVSHHAFIITISLESLSAFSSSASYHVYSKALISLPSINGIHSIQVSFLQSVPRSLADSPICWIGWLLILNNALFSKCSCYECRRMKKYLES
jgi:hypothetical protein